MTLLVAKEKNPGDGRWEKVGLVRVAKSGRCSFPKCLQGQAGAFFAKSLVRMHREDSAIVGSQFQAGLTAYRVDIL